jgi:N-methylhydantoinase B
MFMPVKAWAESAEMEPFTFEVLRDTYYHVCRDMATELRKICISTVIRDAQDFATALTDSQGRLIAQSIGTPGHYNSVPNAVNGLLQWFPPQTLAPGDMLMTNDPWLCAGHLPDIIVVAPIFWRDELIAFAATVAHHIDVGGKNPGSTTANTTEIFQEGLQLPPLKYFEAGRKNAAVDAIIRQNVRLPDVVAHDLECQMAVNARATRAMLELCRKYGADVLAKSFDRAIADSEELMRAEIERIPDGTYCYEDFLDDDGLVDEPLRIAAALTVAAGELTVDFAGSSPQTRGGINMTPSFRDSYTHLAIRCYLDPDIPQNQGCFAPVTITAPEGTIVNPRRTAAVAGRSPVISRVVDVVMACLAQALPQRAVAGYGGCNAQPVISGTDPATRRYFIFLDSNWGGLGARAGKDGVTCLSFPQNVGNHPVEVLESRYPVHIERYEIRTDSEGAGRRRGGFGSIKDYRFLADVELQVPGDRVKIPPFGLFGGHHAIATSYVQVRGDEETALKTKHAYQLHAGDVLSVRTPGGGGLGDPMQRDPQLVADDVRRSYITKERAASVYGVVLDERGEVDEAQTLVARQVPAAPVDAVASRKRADGSYGE